MSSDLKIKDQIKQGDKSENCTVETLQLSYPNGNSSILNLSRFDLGSDFSWLQKSKSNDNTQNEPISLLDKENPANEEDPLSELVTKFQNLNLKVSPIEAKKRIKSKIRTHYVKKSRPKNRSKQSSKSHLEHSSQETIIGSTTTNHTFVKVLPNECTHSDFNLSNATEPTLLNFALTTNTLNESVPVESNTTYGILETNNDNDIHTLGNYTFRTIYYSCSENNDSEEEEGTSHSTNIYQETVIPNNETTTRSETNTLTTENLTVIKDQNLVSNETRILDYLSPHQRLSLSKENFDKHVHFNNITRSISEEILTEHNKINRVDNNIILKDRTVSLESVQPNNETRTKLDPFIITTEISNVNKDQNPASNETKILSYQAPHKRSSLPIDYLTNPVDFNSITRSISEEVLIENSRISRTDDVAVLKKKTVSFEDIFQNKLQLNDGDLYVTFNKVIGEALTRKIDTTIETGVQGTTNWIQQKRSIVPINCHFSAKKNAKFKSTPRSSCSSTTDLYITDFSPIVAIPKGFSRRNLDTKIVKLKAAKSEPSLCELLAETEGNLQNATSQSTESLLERPKCDTKKQIVKKLDETYSRSNIQKPSNSSESTDKPTTMKIRPEVPNSRLPKTKSRIPAPILKRKK